MLSLTRGAETEVTNGLFIGDKCPPRGRHPPLVPMPVSR
jgi:hypothetical protein